jgi:hypothetical protein
MVEFAGSPKRKNGKNAKAPVFARKGALFSFFQPWTLGKEERGAATLLSVP